MSSFLLSDEERVVARVYGLRCAALILVNVRHEAQCCDKSVVRLKPVRGANPDFAALHPGYKLSAKLTRLENLALLRTLDGFASSLVLDRLRQP